MSTRTKRNIRPAASKPKTKAKELFRDVQALVVAGLGEFETLSAQVVHDKINATGGSSDLLTKSKKLTNLKKYSHILVPSNVSQKELSTYLKLPNLDQITDKLVDYHWATDTLDQNSKCDTTDYIYTGGRKKRKTSSKPEKVITTEPEAQPAKKSAKPEKVTTTEPEAQPAKKSAKPAKKPKSSKEETQPSPRAAKRKTSGKAGAKKPPQKSTDVSEEELEFNKAHNLNDHLTKHFQRMETFYRVLGDRGRSIAYANITRTLKMLPFHVKEASQLSNVQGFGEKTVRRIDEILKTGKLGQLKNMEKQKFIQTMEEFDKVHGIGIKKASQIYKKGITSVPQLQQFAEENPNFLSREQLLGIKYYQDLIQPIPRTEIEKIAEKVRGVLHDIDSEAELIITGSYRRNKPESGDIDLIIKLNSIRGVLNQLVSKLDEFGLIKEVLKQSDKTLMSIVQFENNPCRRLDIKLCNPEAFPFMLLYFTGSFEYNRLLRTEAARKGYVLGNEGVHDRKTGRKVNIDAKTEEDILTWLGMPVISPEDRDI